MTFASKRDVWLVAVLGIAVAALSAGIAAVFVSPLPGRLKAFAIVPLVLSDLLIVSTLVATGYTLEPGVLIIRSGPFRWRVPIAEIVRVYPTRSPLSSPALSLDRLAIVYNRGGTRREIMVSPNDAAGFVRALRMANPRIA